RATRPREDGCDRRAVRRCPAIGASAPRRLRSGAALAEPSSPLLIPVDDSVAPALEHDLEVAPANRLLCPPAVDAAPLLADACAAFGVDPTGRAVEGRLDERRLRRVPPHRGTGRRRY